MLKHFINGIYQDNLEMGSIIDAVQPELDERAERIRAHFHDTFPNTATLEGVLKWEIILGIVADPTIEPLEFRRGRILNRLASNVPYTERALQAIIDGIMGEGNWSYSLDYRNYTLDINSLRHGKNWVNEMKLTLEKMLPANLIYNLNIRYNQHQALADYTHAYLSQFTHAQIREEELG